MTVTVSGSFGDSDSQSVCDCDSVSDSQASKKFLAGVLMVSEESSFVGQIVIQGCAFFSLPISLKNFHILSYELAILSLVPGSVNVLSHTTKVYNKKTF